MKKHRSLFITTLAIITISATATPVFSWAKSEGSCYARGDMYASLGLSLHHLGVFAAFDYGIHDCISAGAAIGYDGYSLLGTRHHHLPIMARVAFHPFNLAALADKIVFRDVVDFYAGIAAGWVQVWIKTDTPSLKAEDDVSKFRIREHLGMRYHLNGKWSFFVEGNGWMSTVGGGVSYKF